MSRCKSCKCPNCLIQCNKCAVKTHDITYEFKTMWGYDSKGKDCDIDQWALCKNCHLEFLSSLKMSCSKCQTTISSDEEYATIKGIRGQTFHVCEVCYEHYILSFKKPILNICNIFTGEEAKPLTKSRIEQ